MGTRTRRSGGTRAAPQRHCGGRRCKRRTEHDVGDASLVKIRGRHSKPGSRTRRPTLQARRRRNATRAAVSASSARFENRATEMWETIACLSGRLTAAIAELRAQRPGPRNATPRTHSESPRGPGPLQRQFGQRGKTRTMGNTRRRALHERRTRTARRTRAGSDGRSAHALRAVSRSPCLRAEGERSGAWEHELGLHSN